MGLIDVVLVLSMASPVPDNSPVAAVPHVVVARQTLGGVARLLSTALHRCRSCNHLCPKQLRQDQQPLTGPASTQVAAQCEMNKLTRNKRGGPDGVIGAGQRTGVVGAGHLTGVIGAVVGVGGDCHFTGVRATDGLRSCGPQDGTGVRGSGGADPGKSDVANGRYTGVTRG